MTSALAPDNVTIQTHRNRWVVPLNPKLIKLLIAENILNANDLWFDSSADRQKFIRRMLLLAVQDEWQSHCPSSLGQLARELIQNQDPQSTTGPASSNLTR